MKALKVLAVLLLATFTYSAASAQMRHHPKPHHRHHRPMRHHHR